MPCFIPRAARAALPLVLFAQAAAADVTPAEVWADWRVYMEGMGYVVDGTETADGADLTVSDLRFGSLAPEGGGAMAVSLGTLTFKQNADGSVAVVMPEVMPITVDITPADAESKPLQFDIDLTQTAPLMTVSGDAQQMTYAYSAETAGLILTQLQVGGETFGAENAGFNLLATGLAARTEAKVGEKRVQEQIASIENLQYELLVNNPMEATAMRLKGAGSDIGITGGSTMPLTAEAEGLGDMIAAGFTGKGRLTFGGGGTVLNLSDPVNGDVNIVTASDGGNLDVSLAPEGLGYAGQQTGISVDLNLPGMTFPIQFAMEEGAFDLDVPVLTSAEAQPFSALIDLDGFSMSDAIWNIFDPAQDLPRSSASVLLDLAGRVRLLADLFDPATAERMADPEAQPAEIQSLTLNALSVKALDAELTGEGSVEFDNEDLAAYQGMPKPVGQVTLALAGANALIDQLVASGLLPQQQAMGARMVLGLFAKPGDDPDTLTSEIRFTPAGEILANGQRIR